MPINLKNPFNIRKNSYVSSKMMCSKGIGLKSLLTKISEGESDNNHVLVRSAVKPYPSCNTSIHDHDYCYLKSCHLCHKNLSLHKDIYMYRGDQGFCSIECRDRQIVMDELEEQEASSNQMLKSYRQRSSNRHQKALVLHGLHPRNKQLPGLRNWAIAS